ncbi:MAG: hypothetical protein JNK87_14270 [Bryobacterales bacterium]|nr:hypothetical protein [Bryobacterales bacterium]
MSRAAWAFRPIFFLPLESRHQFNIYPREGGLQPVTSVNATELRFELRGIAEDGEKLIGSHAAAFLAVNAPILVQDPKAGIQRQYGIANPGVRLEIITHHM